MTAARISEEARMSAAFSGPLVRLPSGRVIGAEINDRGNLVPHEWDCDCRRCDPEAEAKRQRVRDAAPDLLAALIEVRDAIRGPVSKQFNQTVTIGQRMMIGIERIDAAIAKATS